MRTNNLLSVVVSELTRLNIEFKVTSTSKVEFIVFNCKHSVEAVLDDNDYTLSYMASNGQSFSFTRQSWSKEVEGKKMGLKMYFERLEENMKPSSKYYQKAPHYNSYQTYGAEIHDELQQAHKKIGEARKVIENMTVELVSLRDETKVKDNLITQLRQELSKYDNYNDQGMRELEDQHGSYIAHQQVITPGSFIIDEE